MPAETAVLPDELQQRNRELTILNTIAQALNGTLVLEDALQTTLAHVTDLFGLETGWIWLLREDTGKNYLAAAQNLPPGLANHPERMTGSCYCLSTYREGDLQGAANVNVVQCSRLEWLHEGTNGLAFHASVPLNAHGKKLGLLNLASRDWRELSAENLRMLYTVGDLLGIAVERVRLFQQSAALGAMRERNRLAREIHDTLAQGLAAVALHLESAETLLELDAGPERVRQAVSKALSLTRTNLEEARRSVLDLRAAPLEGSTFSEALRALIDGLDAKVVYEVVGEERPLPSRIETGLYRIAQEAINNVRQHALAANVTIQLIYEPEKIALVVDDDGVGFDPEHLPAERFGLRGLTERVHLLGGALDVQSCPGSGARLHVSLPLTPK
ncbi:MAG: GAF domain-containing sensor histidine kinase [Ardenticatenaceae bacterium]|nr:GAF domain-containing sensor histidine kinase [Ardenticatenaceae bacterium]